MKHFLQVFVSIYIFSSFSFAEKPLDFVYNILPKDANTSVIDSKQSKLEFNIYENQGNIFYQGGIIPVVNDIISVPLTSLSGPQEFVFTNSLDDKVVFLYYISDEIGYVPDYRLPGADELKVYITTLDKIKIIYTESDLETVKVLVTFLNEIPDKVKVNLKEIQMLPFENSSFAAGITNYNKIKFYNLSHYSYITSRNIVFHEVAHTWAHNLIQNKIVDYSFTDYAQNVIKDNNFVSNYSKAFIIEKRNYSEDFADSISFYLMDKVSFKKNHPNRATYIETLLSN